MNDDTDIHEDILWQQRMDTVSKFVREQFPALTDKEVSKILKDWVFLHQEEDNDLVYLDELIEEAYSFYQGFVGGFNPTAESFAHFASIALKPFFKTKRTPQMTLELIKILLMDEDERNDL